MSNYISKLFTGLTQVPGEERQTCLPGDPSSSSYRFTLTEIHSISIEIHSNSISRAFYDF